MHAVQGPAVSSGEREGLHPFALPLRWLRRVIDYHLLVGELEHLPPALLADLGIARHEIRSFAARATWGSEPPPRGEALPDEPMTRIGDQVWSRAFLLRIDR